MRRSQPLLYIALAIFLAAGAAAFVLQAAAAFKTPAELDYGEGILLWQAANVTNWKKAFHPVEEYPHVVFHYPPLFHLTSRFVAFFTGDLLQAGRLTSILSLAGTCLVGALLTAAVLPPAANRFPRFIGAFTAGTLVFTTPIWFWACLMRVDTLGIFLTVCGVALFVLARWRRALAFLAFACFVAAVYTKQTGLAGPVACFALALVERPRYAVQLLLFAVSLGLGILLMLYTATDGLILRHLITYNQNPYFPEQLFTKLKDHAAMVVAPLFFSLLLPVALLRRRVRRATGPVHMIRLILTRTDFERAVIVIGLYALCAAAIAAATISKVGAYDNYFLEMDIAICLLAGLFLGWFLRRISFRPHRPHLVLQMIVIVIFLVHTFGNWTSLYNRGMAWAHPPFDRSPEVVRFLKDLPGPVYSEDMVILMQAGKEVPAEPAIISALALDGKWDETPFVERIRNGEFGAVVIRYSLTNRHRFSEPIARAIEERYYPIKDFEPFTVYLPK
jgi:hypothetical protein